MQQNINSQDPNLIFNTPRSPQWPAVKNAHLAKENGCVACKLQGPGLLQVHHIIPFQYCTAIGRPELEFNPANLMTLCEGPGTKEHHIAIGHLGDFQWFNQEVETDISGPWKDLDNETIEGDADYNSRRRWPAKPLSADDINNLTALMVERYGPKPQESIDQLIAQWYPRQAASGSIPPTDTSGIQGSTV